MTGPWGRAAGYRVTPKNLDSIRAIALNVRRELDIGTARVSMINLLEVKLYNVGLHFHIVGDDDIPGEAARAIPHAGLILITETAYEGIHRGDPEYELLVPHELGHIVLEHSVTLAFANPRGAHPANEDSEVQADYFSHELTMPVQLVLRYCQSVTAIQRAFNVPQIDAAIRADMLRRERLITW
jgi:hypothetical protein